MSIVKYFWVLNTEGFCVLNTAPWVENVIAIAGFKRKESNYEIHKTEDDFPECIPCKNKAFCAMCMVRNANEHPNGDFLKINKHFCEVAAINRKIVLDWKQQK